MKSLSRVNKAMYSSGDQRKKKELPLSYGGLSLSLKGVGLVRVDICCGEFFISGNFCFSFVFGFLNVC